MKNLLFLSFLFLISFSACDCTTQYGVNVKNSTSEVITLVFKSKREKGSSDEKTLSLQPGEFKQIIYTENFKPDEECTGCIPDHCLLIAEYVNAFQGETPSKIKWCDKSIAFSKTDIGQAEFTINYKPEDF